MNVPEFAVEVERRLRDHITSPLSPGSVARLVGATFSPAPHSRALLHQLHKFLLERTVRHARARTRYYAAPAYAGWAETPPGAPPDLSGWPVLRRQNVIEAFADFIADDVTFESACHTSGITGAPLNLYKSQEELKFLWGYYSSLLGLYSGGVGSRPLTLFFPNLFHGTPVRLPTFGRVFTGGVKDELLIAEAHRQLQESFAIPGHDPRISVLSGLSLDLKFFTGYLLERGHDLRGLGVRQIRLVGEQVTRASRRFLQDAWGAVAFERYSLAESAGGASRCERCGRFHLDPNVIGEVIDPDDGRTLEETGIGRLAVTQLHPFVQMQPLLRYDTGDLVRLHPRDCAHTLTFDFLGRASNCVSRNLGGRTEWLLFSADLFEMLSEIPDINTYNLYDSVPSSRCGVPGSAHIFRLEVSPPEPAPLVIDLSFELRYLPEFYRERVAELEADIVRRLRAMPTALSARLDDGSVALRLRFLAPGGLGGAFKIKL